MGTKAAYSILLASILSSKQSSQLGDWLSVTKPSSILKWRFKPRSPTYECEILIPTAHWLSWDGCFLIIDSSQSLVIHSNHMGKNYPWWFLYLTKMNPSSKAKITLERALPILL